MFVGSIARVKSMKIHKSVNAAGSSVLPFESLRIIGVTLDRHLSFCSHITRLWTECNYHIRALWHIRPLLDTFTANTVACSIVQTRLDYCNSLFYGISERNLDQLQHVLNSLARVVCCAARRDHVSVLRKKKLTLVARANATHSGTGPALISHRPSPIRTPNAIIDLRESLQLRCTCSLERTAGNPLWSTGTQHFQETIENFPFLQRL